MTVIEEMAERVGEVAGRAGDSVVGLGGHRVQGSGVVIAPRLVLTNAHNVLSDNPTIRFLASGPEPGRSEQGIVVGVDVDRDLAILEVDTGETPSIPWSPEEVALAIGAPVIGLANPGGRGLRATFGMVAAADRSFRGPRGRRMPGGFEHTALAPPGASGGPVVDMEGHLVGINTRRLGRGFYLAQTAGLELRSAVDALRGGGRAEPRRLGVGLAPAEVARRLRRTLGLDAVDGLLVRLVEEGSPAEQTGVREGDVLVSAGGRATTDIDELHQILDSAGDMLELGLVRVNDRLDVTVSLA